MSNLKRWLQKIWNRTFRNYLSIYKYNSFQDLFIIMWSYARYFVGNYFYFQELHVHWSCNTSSHDNLMIWRKKNLTFLGTVDDIWAWCSWSSLHILKTNLQEVLVQNRVISIFYKNLQQSAVQHFFVQKMSRHVSWPLTVSITFSKFQWAIYGKFHDRQLSLTPWIVNLLY